MTNAIFHFETSSTEHSNTVTATFMHEKVKRIREEITREDAFSTTFPGQDTINPVKLFISYTFSF